MPDENRTRTIGLTAENLAEALVGVGGGVTVWDAVFTGDGVAAGTFSGGAGIIGFDGSIILSTGNIAGVAGPNNVSGYSNSNGSDGDTELTALATLEGQTGETYFWLCTPARICRPSAVWVSTESAAPAESAPSAGGGFGNGILAMPLGLGLAFLSINRRRKR